MSLRMNRREVMALGATSLAALSLSGKALSEESALAEIPAAIVQAHEEGLARSLSGQIVDGRSKWCGSFPDQFDLHYPQAAAGFLRDAAAAYFNRESKFHASGDLLDRMKLAADFLVRCQNADGNIDLLATNFNSPPDTGFVVHSVATAAKLARMHDDETVLSLTKGFLLSAGEGLRKGGIHTPNHRWVVSAALAQIHDLFPDPRYVERIDQWLGEGIDIDEEGQFTERSTAGYNTVVNSALVVLAHKLDRPELLEPVRKNLDAMAYLLHPDGEVVTEISRRQDLNTRGTMGGYWFVLRYLAVRDENGLYASMLKPLEPDRVELARLMEYPELRKALPEPTPIPEDYEKDYPLAGISRIRRGQTSVTIMHKDNSRWISLRRGKAVINAVRFATAFFGKGQFVPSSFEKRSHGYYFKQEITGRYLQPLTDPALLPVTPENWTRLAMKRRVSEICRMMYEAAIRETAQGFEIAIAARGTDNVPLAVEINLREGGELTGVDAVPDTPGAFLLRDGFAEYRVGTDAIRFGPGLCEHTWAQLRGAEGKLPGPSVYLTSYSPLDYTIVIYGI